MNELIQPFGSKDLIAPLIDKKSERDFQKLEAEFLSKMYLNESALSNIVMLGSGYFSPLKGFMNSSQTSVCTHNDRLSPVNSTTWFSVFQRYHAVICASIDKCDDCSGHNHSISSHQFLWYYHSM